jgi:hypothetical protein
MREVFLMRNKKARNTGNILGDIIQKYNLEEDVLEYNIMNRWADIVGIELNNICKPVAYKDGKLILKAKNSIWLQELGNKRKELLNSIKTKTRVAKITHIELI